MSWLSFTSVVKDVCGLRHGQLGAVERLPLRSSSLRHVNPNKRLSVNWIIKVAQEVARHSLVLNKVSLKS